MPLRSNFSEADQSVASSIGTFIKNKSNTSNIVNNQYSVNSLNFDNATPGQDSTNDNTFLPQESTQTREQDRSRRFSKRYSQSLSARASINLDAWENYLDQAALIVGDALRSNPSSKGSTPCGSPASPAITTNVKKNTDTSEVNYIFVKSSPKKEQDNESEFMTNVSGISIRSAPSPTETNDGTFSSVFSTPKSLKRLSNGATGLLKNKLDLFVSKGSTFADDDFYLGSKYTRSKSVSSLKSKSHSAPELESQAFDELIEEPTKSSTSDFDETTKIINNFNNIETLIDDMDGRKLVREFMKKRCNEELLLYLEVVRTFKKINAAQCKQSSNPTESNTDGTPVESPRVTNLISATNATSLSCEFLKMKEFQLVHIQFISIDSTHCINVDHTIRDKFSQLYKELISQEFNEKTAQSMYEKFSECLDQLYITISLQFKNEIFPQFKRTDDYRDLLLQKVIEKHDAEAFCPENSSIESLLSKIDMKECWKKFKKKKLETLGQIQDFTTEDYKKIGISKLGHLKRISKAVKDHFNRCEEMKKSISCSIFQTPVTPRE